MILKDNYKRSEVIHRHFLHWFLYNFRRHSSNKLVLVFIFLCIIFIIPKALGNFFVIELIINSIRTHHYEIVFLAVDLEIGYLWFGYQYFGIAIVLGKFCLDISEGPRNWQFSRLYSIRSKNCITIFTFNCTLINFAPSIKNSLSFCVWIRFVVFGDWVDIFS